MASTFRSTWGMNSGDARTLWHDGVTNLDLPAQLHPGGVFFITVVQGVPATPTITLTTPLMGNGTKPYTNMIRLGHPVALVKNQNASTHPCRIGDVLGNELYLVPVDTAVYVLPIGWGPNLVEGEWVFIPL